MKTRSLHLILCTMFFLGACASTRDDVKWSAKNPVIYLDRTACFGACPAYTLTLKGDGTASYIGKSNVDKIGTYTATVDQKSLLFLIHAFDAAHFFALKDIYDDLVTDIPTYTVKYTFNDSTKTITDRFNAPEQLRDLERSIDSVADRLSWKKVSE